MRTISTILAGIVIHALPRLRRLCDPLLASPQFDVEHAAASDPEIAMQGAFELRIKLFDFDRGEKAETAQVHGE